MEIVAKYGTTMANVLMALATLFLAFQASRQLSFMKKESQLSKYPNVLLFPEGLFVESKPPVEHHEENEPLGFVLFNSNPNPVVYINGHIFKWDANRKLTASVMRNLVYGSSEHGWIGALYPSFPQGYDHEIVKHLTSKTVSVAPSGTLTLRVHNNNALDTLLSEEYSKGGAFFVLITITLAYPLSPGGIVQIGVPFKLEYRNRKKDMHWDFFLVGEMITGQIVYCSPVKEKGVDF
ncbi:hypothetical protein [Oceanithermus sp.]|uniref:hypothetical protein n=1 Tax=Oceanithermus sp. TaxID=2268145 RepID=UPI0025810887|nr:hypothetical protein [Oceanithermus sp.]